MGTAIISDGLAGESATLGRTCGGARRRGPAGGGGSSWSARDLPPPPRPGRAAHRLKWDDAQGGSKTMMRSLRALARLSLLVAPGMLAPPAHPPPPPLKPPPPSPPTPPPTPPPPPPPP